MSRMFPLPWPGAMQIYWNKKDVYITNEFNFQDLFGIPT